MREHLPSGCAVVRALDLTALEAIAKEVMARSTPIVSMMDEDPLELYDQITCEVSRLWENIEPSQIAYIIKKSSEDEWNDPDVMEYFYGLSVEDIVLDCVDSFLIENIEDILADCLGPGEDCGYHIYIKTFDDEVTEERLQDMSDALNDDDNDDEEEDDDCLHDDNDDDDDEAEEVPIDMMLDGNTWQEDGLVKGYTVEVTGENAAVYIEDNGKKKLAIPNFLQLLHKLRSATPGEWYEHKPGWRYRLMPERVADPI